MSKNSRSTESYGPAKWLGLIWLDVETPWYEKVRSKKLGLEKLSGLAIKEEGAENGFGNGRKTYFRIQPNAKFTCKYNFIRIHLKYTIFLIVFYKLV